MKIFGSKVIGSFIGTIFEEQKFIIFCYDRFPMVYQTFTKETTFEQRIANLVEYCAMKGKLSELLIQLQPMNPTKYNEFEVKLQSILKRNQTTVIKQIGNPFHYLNAVSPNEFIGRWPLVKQMGDDLVLDHGDSYACIGGRRFGKTSLLNVLHHYLRQPENQGDHIPLPVIIDFKAYKFNSAEHLFATILEQIRRRVEINISNPPQDDSETKVILDGISNILLNGLTNISLQKFEEALRYILDELYEEGGATRFVILLDEVDEVLQYDWHRQVFNQLRSLIYSSDLKSNIRLVLAGSDRFLNEVNDSGSPLWNVLKLEYLTNIDQAATYELSERAEGISEIVKHAVWVQSGGHPFLAQYLLHHLWNMNISQVNETDVLKIAIRFLHEMQVHVQGWGQAIGPTALEIYGLIAEKSDWLEETEIIKLVNNPNTLVKRNLINLYYHGFIIHDGNWERYHSAGELLRKWYIQEGKRIS